MTKHTPATPLPQCSAIILMTACSNDECDRLRDALHKIAYDPFGEPTASHQEVLDAITDFARGVIGESK